jgi:hypothetical protein
MKQMEISIFFMEEKIVNEEEHIFPQKQGYVTASGLRDKNITINTSNVLEYKSKKID